MPEWFHKVLYWLDDASTKTKIVLAVGVVAVILLAAHNAFAQAPQTNALGERCLQTEEWFEYQGVDMSMVSHEGTIADERFLKEFLYATKAPDRFVDHARLAEVFLVASNGAPTGVMVLQDDDGCVISFMLGPVYAPEFQAIFSYLSGQKGA